MHRIKTIINQFIPFYTLPYLVLGNAILSFGIYNIHRVCAITEGGVLGGILLLNYWFNIPTSVASALLDICCYILAYHYLGKQFLKISLVSSVLIALFFRLWELFPPFLPNLSFHPLLATVIGGMFVGIGTGIVVMSGGSCGGDDALALAIEKISNIPLAYCYLFTDITVLLLSLSYIPVKNILISLITVSISSWTIGLFSKYKIQPYVR